MRTVLILVLLPLAAWVVTLSGSLRPPPLEPRAVAAKVDECRTCGMLVTVEPFAAQALWKNGDVEMFDSAACMQEHLRKSAPADRMVVRVMDGSEWIDAHQAWFVMGLPGSPMDGAPAAFKSEAEARRAGAAVRYGEWK